MLDVACYSGRLVRSGRAMPHRLRRTLNQAVNYACPTGADACQLRRAPERLSRRATLPCNVPGLFTAPRRPTGCGLAAARARAEGEREALSATAACWAALRAISPYGFVTVNGERNTSGITPGRSGTSNGERNISGRTSGLSGNGSGERKVSSITPGGAPAPIVPL